MIIGQKLVEKWERERRRQSLRLRSEWTSWILFSLAPFATTVTASSAACKFSFNPLFPLCIYLLRKALSSICYRLLGGATERIQGFFFLHTAWYCGLCLLRSMDDDTTCSVPLFSFIINGVDVITQNLAGFSLLAHTPVTHFVLNLVSVT